MAVAAAAGVEVARAQERRMLLKAENADDGLDGEWIAVGSGFEDKQALHTAIQRVQKEVDGSGIMGLFSFGSDPVTSEAEIQEAQYVSFRCSEACAMQVLDIEGVEMVQQDMVVSLDGRRRRRRKGKGDSSSPKPGTSIGSWGLNRIDQESLPLSEGVPFTYSHSGAGVNIYIIDTGVNEYHNEWAGRGGMGFSSINEDTKGDGHGHGSHCAGTALGSTYGVARGANLIGVKVLSASGGGSTSGVIKGVEWAVNNQKKKFKNQAAVLSMSLGGGASSAMDKAVNAASSAGHIVVVAAGNANDNACKFSPARANQAITVGSTTKSDQRSYFSNYGNCVDIWAPGSDIKSAWKGSFQATNTISGTSMAAPHVAGVAALLLEKHNGDKSAARNELMGITAKGKIKDVKNGSPNMLLQTPRYTGPPTPPTSMPTLPPTRAPVKLCRDGQTECYNFADSIYAPLNPTKWLEGQVVYEKANPYGCSRKTTGKDLEGKFLLVDRGGCLFFDKSKIGEERGALATIIARSTPGDAYPPNYYGDGKTTQTTVMMGFSDAKKLKKRMKKNPILSLGSISVKNEQGEGEGGDDGEEATPAPTPPKGGKGRRRRRRRRRGLGSTTTFADEQ